MSQKEEQENNMEQSADKPFKRSVEIFDEENSIIIDDEYDVADFKFYFEKKKFKITDSIKDDPHTNYLEYEYKISSNPIEMYIRLTEKSSEPPFQDSVKDGVVLESEIKKGNFLANTIEDLTKEVEWNKIGIFGNYEVNLYILSKHPEIISQEEYRKFLRQSIERIKKGVDKVEEAVKKDKHNLQIHSYNSGKGIWYPESKSEEKESEAYWDLPKEKRDNSPYGKKLKYVEDFNKSLFDEKSPSYIGISENEFGNNDEIVKYIQKLLKQDLEPAPKTKDVPTEKQLEKNKTYTVLVYLTTALFIFLKLTNNLHWNWLGVLAPVLVWEGFGFFIGFLQRLNK